jgi:Flp pilus assembly protein TadG
MTRSAELRMRRCNREGGAAAVEFALVVWVLVTLVGGIIDFGFAFNAQISLTHAAREGVRVEAIGTGDAETAAGDAFSAIAVTDFGADLTQPCPNSLNEARLETSARYDAFFLSFLSRELQGEAVMRCGG